MKIIIPGIPIAKARHKLCRRGNYPSMYDPQDTQKKSVKNLIRHLYSQTFLPDWNAYKIILIFYMPYHKDTFPWMPEHHIKKSDCDNLCKFYLDCCSGILFKDDKQIVEIYSKKLYSDIPRTEIDIMPLEDVQIDENVKKVMNIFSPITLKSLLDEFHNLNIVYNKLDRGAINDEYVSLLTTTASLLVSIAKLYKDPLNKIARLEDIPCNTSHFQTYLGEHPTEIF